MLSCRRLTRATAHAAAHAKSRAGAARHGLGPIRAERLPAQFWRILNYKRFLLQSQMAIWGNSGGKKGSDELSARGFPGAKDPRAHQNRRQHGLRKSLLLLVMIQVVPGVGSWPYRR
jgi:hypothetical protein